MAALAALYAVCVYARSLCASVFNRGEEGALFECVTDKIHDERESFEGTRGKGRNSRSHTSATRLDLARRACRGYQNTDLNLKQTLKI